MRDELRRAALISSGVAELTRHQTEKIVKELVKGGEGRRKQASSVVKDILDTSKTAGTELSRVIRSEIRNQMASLGIVTKRDLERLERRVARLESTKKKKTTARSSTSKSRSSTTSKSSASRSSGSSGNPPSKTST